MIQIYVNELSFDRVLKIEYNRNVVKSLKKIDKFLFLKFFASYLSSNTTAVVEDLLISFLSVKIHILYFEDEKMSIRSFLKEFDKKLTRRWYFRTYRNNILAKTKKIKSMKITKFFYRLELQILSIFPRCSRLSRVKSNADKPIYGHSIRNYIIGSNFLAQKQWDKVTRKFPIFANTAQNCFLNSIFVLSQNGLGFNGLS